MIYTCVSPLCLVSFQLQKGPVQLPAFSLSPHLSDRQQDSSVNLKPSELRHSQLRPDSGPVSGEGLQRHDSEPVLRGILKKSCFGGSEWSRATCHEQNGGGCEDAETQGRMESTERQEVPAAPRRERRQAPGVEGDSLPAAPWRQRARTRRETIACTPIRALPEQDAAQGERGGQTELQEQLLSSVEHRSDTTGRVQ